VNPGGNQSPAAGQGKLAARSDRGQPGIVRVVPYPHEPHPFAWARSGGPVARRGWRTADLQPLPGNRSPYRVRGIPWARYG